MPRFKYLNNVRIQFTAEEEAQRDKDDAAAIAAKPANALANLRRLRNNLLAETDFYALQDVTMSEDMETYRQALRDLPSGLTTVEEVQAANYPMKPGA